MLAPPHREATPADPGSCSVIRADGECIDIDELISQRYGRALLLAPSEPC